jgi:uncharacterized 2Fe-2S/4Fe-4S cluster protein (DUF4445 family)
MNLNRVKTVGVKTKLRIPKTVLEFLTGKKIPVPAVCGGKGLCGLCRVRIRGKKMPIHSNEARRISPRMIKNGYRLACRQHWSKELRISVPRTTAAPVKTEQSIGLAIDIGTTVIKTAALDLKSGMITGRQAVYNPQNNLGGDILTRVTEALNGKERVLRAWGHRRRP